MFLTFEPIKISENGLLEISLLLKHHNDIKRH